MARGRMADGKRMAMADGLNAINPSATTISHAVIRHQPLAIGYWCIQNGERLRKQDVEKQQAQRPRVTAGVRTPEQREADARRRTLELSLARTEADLRAATSPVHRRMLEQALVALRESLGRDSLNDVS